jgi:hypothetical protein
MEQSAASIRIPGLTKLDKLELEEEFEPGSVQFEDQEMKGARHGEPTTVAIVLVSAMAIRALAAWLLKERKSDSIEHVVEIVDQNGKRRVETIKINLTSSKAPKADVIRQLGRLCKVDLGLLEEKK